MYADNVTGSMQKTIDETNRRREKQLKYNEEMGITPAQIVRKTGSVLMGWEEGVELSKPILNLTDLILLLILLLNI